MRAIFRSLGVADVVTKSVGTSNPYNMIRATFEALGDQTSPKAVAQRRGKKIADLLGRGHGATSRLPRRKPRPSWKWRPWLPSKSSDRFADPPHQDQRATLVGLGLNKMHKVAELQDTLKSAA